MGINFTDNLRQIECDSCEGRGYVDGLGSCPVCQKSLLGPVIWDWVLLIAMIVLTVMVWHDYGSDHVLFLGALLGCLVWFANVVVDTADYLREGLRMSAEDEEEFHRGGGL